MLLFDVLKPLLALLCVLDQWAVALVVLRRGDKGLVQSGGLVRAAGGFLTDALPVEGLMQVGASFNARCAYR